MDGVSVMGASLERFVTTADQCEDLRKFLASVLAGGGRALKLDAEPRGFRFKLRVFGVGMVPKRVLDVWLESYFGDEC